MAKKQKYYVVWEGKQPGIYRTWGECQSNIHGYPAAKYKAFDSLAEAEYAYARNYTTFYKSGSNVNSSEIKTKTTNKTAKTIISNSISVDAACSGNPGIMEYRGVKTATGQQIFHQGPFKDGTNNIGEFLALVHALAMLHKAGDQNTPIYSDSKTALSWVKHKKAKTTLEPTNHNAILFDLISRAENWLHSNTFKNPIIKWETDVWGEIPADFGRK